MCYVSIYLQYFMYVDVIFKWLIYKTWCSYNIET